MLISIGILGSLVVVALLLAYVRGGGEMIAAGVAAGTNILLGVAPQLLLGFLLAGLITVLVPADLIGRAIGEGSGLTGLLIATGAGVLTPGGPFLQFPLLAALARGGAGVGPMAAYLTAWSLLGANRALVWEIPILGVSFTGARWLISLGLPVIVGLIMPVLLRTTR